MTSLNQDVLVLEGINKAFPLYKGRVLLYTIFNINKNILAYIRF